MGNLRSDCRDLVKYLEPGDTYRSHIESLCFQIDDLEERWLSAEQQLSRARNLLRDIVCTGGCDRGVVLLDNLGTSQYDEAAGCHVYDSEYVSPLGDALMQLWYAIQPRVATSITNEQFDPHPYNGEEGT